MEPIARPVHIKVGDELVVGAAHWHAPEHTIVLGTKVNGPAAKFPVLQTIEQIAKIRAAGGREPGYGNPAGARANRRAPRGRG